MVICLQANVLLGIPQGATLASSCTCGIIKKIDALVLPVLIKRDAEDLIVKKIK